MSFEFIAFVIAFFVLVVSGVLVLFYRVTLLHLFLILEAITVASLLMLAVASSVRGTQEYEILGLFVLSFSAAEGALILALQARLAMVGS